MLSVAEPAFIDAPQAPRVQIADREERRGGKPTRAPPPATEPSGCVQRRRHWLLAAAAFAAHAWGPRPATTTRLLAPATAAVLATMAAGVPAPAAAQSLDALREAMRRALTLRDEAVRSGDQAYGAVVLHGDEIVGAAPSRVVVAADPTAHAEMEAIRDAARHLRTRDLSGCVLVSTSRPCRMCESAAMWARISRMVYGEALTDAGPPR
jgi:tRNA(Arg) A34 adenosine deaminase TadA